MLIATFWPGTSARAATETTIELCGTVTPPAATCEAEPVLESRSELVPSAPFEPTDTRAFEVYIPLEEAERNKASEAGKAAPNARKG